MSRRSRTSWSEQKASAASAPGSAATAPAAFERRLDLRRASDASGVTPMLLLPQAFGEIYLGETLSCYVSVGNHSRATARDVGIKCELHTERQRVALRDDTARPIARLQPGESRDFVVEQTAFIAKRARKEAGDDPRAQVRRVFQLLLGRKPSAGELAACRDIDLRLVCRSLINSNEFTFLP